MVGTSASVVAGAKAVDGAAQDGDRAGDHRAVGHFHSLGLYCLWGGSAVARIADSRKSAA
jgi:hypothetical protein